jgi:hypothetical protein
MPDELGFEQLLGQGKKSSRDSTKVHPALVISVLPDPNRIEEAHHRRCI